MSTTTVPTPLAEGFVSAESPRWSGDALIFSDMYAGQVLSISETGERSVLAEVPDVPTGLGKLPDGRLLIATQRGRQILRLEPTGALIVHADLNPLVNSNLNDMWVDSRGRAYVGSLGVDSEGLLKQLEQQYPTREAAVAELMRRVRELPGAIHLVSPDGTVRTVAEDVLLPNGLTLDAEERMLFVNASLEPAVRAYDIDEDGGLRLTKSFPLDFPPDGMSMVDAEGAFWIADPEGHGAVRLNQAGQRLDRIDTTRKCLAVALGGGDGHTLFLCTTRTNDPKQAAAERASSIETAHVVVPCAKH